jgi:hypothetical protein
MAPTCAIESQDTEDGLGDTRPFEHFLNFFDEPHCTDVDTVNPCSFENGMLS